MVGEVGVHDNDEVSASRFEAMDIGGAEAEFASSRLEDNAIGGVKRLELFGDI